MTRSVAFFVPGIPAPGGSKRAFRVGSRINIVDAGGEKTKNWRAVVALAARKAWAGKEPMTGALKMKIDFYLPRPKSHFKASGLIHDGAFVLHHTKKPDASKLTRAAEDSLTGIIWRDDAQVVAQEIAKYYSSSTGAAIEVTEIAAAARK